MDFKTTCHYLLHCLNFTNERAILLNIVSTINESSLTSCDASVIKLLLNGDKSLNLDTNTLILNATYQVKGLIVHLYRTNWSYIELICVCYRLKM